ncbi:hypothetical protein AB4Z48_27555 [Cupriavidus sp. 2TAF22]|uniref:hypothetical protein n=1 Tax=unclassified Cupriavidus TaxID=2640874 RepID=UPI003F91F7BD
MTGHLVVKNFRTLCVSLSSYELDSQPQYCILTYRHAPETVRAALATASADRREKILDALDAPTISLQECSSMPATRLYRALC